MEHEKIIALSNGYKMCPFIELNSIWMCTICLKDEI